MRLTLGTQSLDLTTRALVIGPPGADQPDIVEIPAGDDPPVGGATDTLLAARLDASTSASTRPSVLAAAFDAGAVLVSTTHPDVPLTDLLPACAQAGAAVVVSATGDRMDDVRVRLVDRAGQAEAAGIPSDRVVLEPPLTSALLPHLRRFAELGYPLLLTVTTPIVQTLPGNQAALTALAQIQGARLIRTDAVLGTVRVCRVVSAILEAR